MFRHALRFGLVGGFATLVHVCIGATLIHSGFPALRANAVSFSVAFGVSFVGHLGFSFVDLDNNLVTALGRFALVAVSGFSLNEALLALLLSQTRIPTMLALILTTGAAAIFTFLLSRHWAFRSKADGDAVRFGAWR